MEPPSPEDLLKKVESSESFINKLVIAWREKQWVKLLLLFGFVALAFLNQTVVFNAVQFIYKSPEFKLPDWYFYVWLIVTIAAFIAAFIVALRTTPTKFPDAPSEKSIIKGLRPYTAEDAELFAKLQRGRMLQDCLTACDDRDFRFGILNGESGTGKTSFLQAGLCPSLKKKDFRPVYVKLTEIAPLDSIREVLVENKEIKRKEADNKNLLELIELAVKENSKPLVIVFDQFEQFFVSHKSKTDRKPFIQEIADWYKRRKSLPVKILFSIRGDYFFRLSEFQDAMKYNLAFHDNFRLEKFSPEEATTVFRIIAEAEKIECDENFIKEITARELSDREDRLVSPVDVQVLSWMIAGQKTADEKAFNRRAFNKLGGVEGLLESFLSKTLDSQTESGKQTIVKVLLALVDLEKNTRAGALPLVEIQTKLKETILANEVAKSVEWLSNRGVRLITPTDDKKEKDTLYELAHERIIPALRKLANKELSETDRAARLLDRRFNEWTGNNNSRQYLLTLKEWLLVRRNKSLITLGINKEQKERFIAQSKRRFIHFIAGYTIILVLAVGSFGFYQWNESRPETKMKYAENRLKMLLERNSAAAPIQNAALLTLALENNGTNVITSDTLLLSIDRLPHTSQAEALLSLADAYISFGMYEASKANDFRSNGKNEEASKAEAYILPAKNSALKLLNKVLPLTEDIPIYYKTRILTSLAESYIKLEKNEDALNLINTVLPLTKNPFVAYQPDVLASLAISYNKLGRNEEALTVLNIIKSRQPIEDQSRYEDISKYYSEYKRIGYEIERLAHTERPFERKVYDVRNQPLLEIAVSFAQLEDWDSALTAIQLMNSEDFQIMAYSRVLMMWKSPEIYKPLDRMFKYHGEFI